MSARVSRSAPFAAAALAAAGVLLAPAAANAQSYGYVPGYGGQTYSQPQRYESQGYYGSQGYGSQGYHDRCTRERQGRTGAGALIGGGLGAVAGSNLAGRHSRTEGALIGGALGAVVGASAGRSSSDNCVSAPYGQPAYSGYSYGSSYGQPSYGYSSSYGSSRSTYYDSDGYGPYTSDGYDRADDRYDDRYDDRDPRYDDRRDPRYDDRRYDDRRYEDRGQVQYSADGYYWYDPSFGWRPR